jgi:hypothetical protein
MMPPVSGLSALTRVTIRPTVRQLTRNSSITAGSPAPPAGGGVVEGAAVPGPGACPGYPGDHHSVLRATDPGRLRLDEALGHPRSTCRQRPPPLAAVVAGGPPPASPAPSLISSAGPNRHHEGGYLPLTVLFDGDVVLDDGPLHPEQPCPYPGSSRAVSPPANRAVKQPERVGATGVFSLSGPQSPMNWAGEPLFVSICVHYSRPSTMGEGALLVHFNACAIDRFVIRLTRKASAE